MMQNGTEDALEASKFANQILVGSALMRAPTSNFLEIPENICHSSNNKASTLKLSPAPQTKKPANN
jgi:hypothetical protein